MYALYSMLIFDCLLSEVPHLNKNNPGKKERLTLPSVIYVSIVIFWMFQLEVMAGVIYCSLISSSDICFLLRIMQYRSSHM